MGALRNFPPNLGSSSMTHTTYPPPSPRPLSTRRPPRRSSSIKAVVASKESCAHPIICKGMCGICGRQVDDTCTIPLKYINKNLRISKDEMARVRGSDLKELICQRKKLYLILDLDHTLLNSSRLIDAEKAEVCLNNDDSLFTIDSIHMMTKLRPFVRTFLEEASNLFEMFIYTMGERPYALEMAKLLDPTNKYFQSRIIARDDSTHNHRKALDILMGHESAVLILDDTEAVWKENKDNLISMDRYHFFASSCKNFGINHPSLSQQGRDESESKGALSTVLQVLQQIHRVFFDERQKDNVMDRDVRQVLKTVKKEVLKDCKIVSAGVEHDHIWRMAEQLGAECSMEVDADVTHVVSSDAGTTESQWALSHDKFLVNVEWLKASTYLWRKQPEVNFPVTSSNNNE